MDVKLASKNQQKQIAELEEWREKAYHSSKLYKERNKRWHDHRIQQKEFKEGDKVLLFNSQVKLFGEGKLRTKWQGPYTIINTSPHGTITIQDDDGNIFKVNSCWWSLSTKSDHQLRDKERRTSMTYIHMLFILTHFHMYWRISILQDIYLEYVENVIKMRNQRRRKAKSAKKNKEKAHVP